MGYRKRNRENIDPSLITDKESAYDLFVKSVRAGVVRDAFQGKTRFKAVVLTAPLPISVAAAMSIGENAVGGRFKFRARIIDSPSPHSIYPDPCDPEIAENAIEVLKRTKLHTEFFSSEIFSMVRPKKGSIVDVELKPNVFSYDLSEGEYVGLVDASTATAQGLTPSVCSPKTMFDTRMGAANGIHNTGVTPPAFTAQTCSDTTPAADDWAERALYYVISNSERSKKFTDVEPLDGGSIGIAHFAGSGLVALYKAMGNSVTQKYFGGRSVSQLKSFHRGKNDCKGTTPVGEHDNGTGCYETSWWKNGMKNFVNSPESKEIQTKAWMSTKAKGAVSFARDYGWVTERQLAIAAGVGNSIGFGKEGGTRGLRPLAELVGADAEKILEAYVAGLHQRSWYRDENGKYTGVYRPHTNASKERTRGNMRKHWGRRAALINKYFPCRDGSTSA